VGGRHVEKSRVGVYREGLFGKTVIFLVHGKHQLPMWIRTDIGYLLKFII